MSTDSRPRIFGLGLCAECGRQERLITSSRGPVCKTCHADLEVDDG